jgi:flavin-dependent dehydrogenase
MGASAELHVGARGYVGLNRIGPGRTNVALVVPAARGVEARGRTEAFFLEALETFPGVSGRVAGGRLARKVLATGPFAAWSGRVVTDGAALVGDAADFFDPFTGEGIYTALRGGELLAPFAAEAARASNPDQADKSLREYERSRRKEFSGKWKVERLVGTAVAFPALIKRAATVLSRRRDMADLLVGVVGDFVPAREVLRPRYLLSLLYSRPA